MTQAISKLSRLVVVGALFALFAAPAFAQDQPTPASSSQPTTSVDRATRRAARKTFVQAVHQANKDYRSARQAARQTLRDALKAAGQDKDARQAAIQAYRDAIKAARDQMQAAKQSARDTYLAAIGRTPAVAGTEQK